MNISPDLHATRRRAELREMRVMADKQNEAYRRSKEQDAGEQFHPLIVIAFWALIGAFMIGVFLHMLWGGRV